MDLRITQSYARIGVIPHPARMTIEQPRAQMNIESKPADMNIETQLPRVVIDQSQCFAESGLKSPRQLVEEFAARGRQTAFEVIGEIAAEGDRLMAIENGGNPIGQLAWDRVYVEKEFNMVTMPMSRPKIDVVGDLKIDIQPNPVKIDWEVHPKANIEATYPRMEFYLLQEPGIQIEYVGKNFDKSI